MALERASTMSAISQLPSLEGPQLEHYPHIATQSPDEAKRLLRETCGLQDFIAHGSESEFFAQVNLKPLTDISLIYAAFGGAVELEFPKATFARQLFRLSGEGVAQAGATLPSLPIDEALPLPTGKSVTLRLSDNCRLIILRIGEAALARKLASLLGREPTEPIQLRWGQSVDSEKLALRSLVMHLVQTIHSLEKCSVLCPVIAELEQSIVTAFLCANSSNYSDLLRAEPEDVGPWQVRAVEDYILSHWNEPIDIHHLAEVTGASARSIFQAFARTRGYSPKAFLKRTRLTHARAKLQASDPKISVTAIALSCGFHNLGRFARDYQTYFGELPSETLAKQRSSRSSLHPHA